MSGFAKAPVSREQLVLFEQKLDEVIPADHRVRLLDAILRRLDWGEWEALYDLQKGQPPIHPRVVASAILYGILNRVYSSRQLEENLLVRNDFRWLVEGHTIDHTTLCKFRQGNAKLLKKLFVQIGMLAHELGFLSLERLGFDGTRMRSNNRRSGSRTPQQIRRAKEELGQQFKRLQAEADQADGQDNQQLDTQSRCKLAEELVDTKRRTERLDAALAALEALDQEPKRLPITDPESRITPNKDGGYAPNYTPTATVDIESGLIASADVIANTDEDKHMMSAVDDVKASFGLNEEPKELLADGMMCTGDNLAACQERKIDFYSPIKLGTENNPAEREDPTVAVAEGDWDRLPVTTTKRDGETITRFNKDAFVYDESENCYWCPNGKALRYRHRTSEVKNGRRRVRSRYRSEVSDCEGCPLRDRCLGKKSKSRQLNHEQHEDLRRVHFRKMRTQDAKDKYAQRRHPGERPFAVIKAKFGVRQFASRGLSRVRKEWLWLASAFNLDRLFSLITSGTDPPEIDLVNP